MEWPSDNHPLPGSVPLKLMTFNMNWGNVRGPEAVAQAVLDDSPDVVCLQEVSPHPPPHLDPVALKHALPGFAFHWFGEMMIASRYPIVARRQFPLPGNLDSRPVLEVDLDVRGRRVRVLDVHLVATHIFGFGPSGIGRMLDVRQAQLKTIEARIDASPYPLVLAGDFNFTPFHAAYRRLGRHLQEAGEGQRGRWDATIPAVFPMRRLDLIFVSKGIDVLAANALDVNASDHEPYRAALSIQDSKVKLTRSD